MLETLAPLMTMSASGTKNATCGDEPASCHEACREVGVISRSVYSPHRFHCLLTVGAAPTLQRQLGILPDRTVRCVRIHQLPEPSWQAPGDIEHARILESAHRRG